MNTFTRPPNLTLFTDRNLFTRCSQMLPPRPMHLAKPVFPVRMPLRDHVAAQLNIIDVCDGDVLQHLKEEHRVKLEP